MAERLGIWLIRLLAAMAGASVFAAAAYVPVVQLLPKQVELEKEFLFLFDADAMVSSWPECSMQIQKNVTDLSGRTSAAFQKNLTFHVEANRPVLTIRCIAIGNSAVETEFYQFLDACADSFSQSRPEMKGTPEDQLCPADRMYLTELREKQRRLQGEIADLEGKYQPLDLETFSLERRLEPAFGKEHSAFQSWIEPFLDKTVASDEMIASLQKKSQQIQQEIVALDQQAARSVTESGLDDVRQRRDQKILELQKMETDLQTRRDFLKGRISDQQWPLYRKHLEMEIEENHRVLAMYACNRNVLKNTLGQVDQNLQSLQRLLLVPADPSNPPMGKTGDSFFLSSVQCPVTKTEMLSPTQTIAILLSAGGGMILALIFIPVRLQREISSSATEDIKTNRLRHTLSPEKTNGETSPPANIDESSVELVRISIQQDLPAGDHSLGNRHWAAEYDQLADLLKPIGEEISCPVILLAAMNPGEASPRVALNLGIALSRRDCRVLLIEADTERSDLADIFDVPVEPGLSDWLQGQLNLEGVLSHQPLDQLFFLPSGRMIPAETQMETGDPAIQLKWAKLREKFDLILLYCPGALSGKAGLCGMSESLKHIIHAALTMARSGANLDDLKHRADRELRSRRIAHLGLIALQ